MGDPIPGITPNKNTASSPNKPSRFKDFSLRFKDLSRKSRIALSLLALAVSSCAQQATANQAESPIPSEQSRAFIVADQFAHQVYSDTAPLITNAGFVDPTLTIAVEMDENNEYQPRHMIAGDNTIAITPISDSQGRTGLIINNFTAHELSDRSRDLVTEAKSPDGKDLLGISEERKLVYRIRNAWEESKGKTEIMTVNFNGGVEETGLKETDELHPDSPDITFPVKINNQIEQKVEVQPSSGQFASFNIPIPATPDGLPIFTETPTAEQPAQILQPTPTNEPLPTVTAETPMLETDPKRPMTFVEVPVTDFKESVSNPDLMRIKNDTLNGFFPPEAGFQTSMTENGVIKIITPDGQILAGPAVIDSKGSAAIFLTTMARSNNLAKRWLSQEQPGSIIFPNLGENDINDEIVRILKIANGILQGQISPNSNFTTTEPTSDVQTFVMVQATKSDKHKIVNSIPKSILEENYKPEKKDSHNNPLNSISGTSAGGVQPEYSLVFSKAPGDSNSSLTLTFDDTYSGKDSYMASGNYFPPDYPNNFLIDDLLRPSILNFFRNRALLDNRLNDPDFPMRDTYIKLTALFPSLNLPFVQYETGGRDNVDRGTANFNSTYYQIVK